MLNLSAGFLRRLDSVFARLRGNSMPLASLLYYIVTASGTIKLVRFVLKAVTIRDLVTCLDLWRGLPVTTILL